MSAAHHLRSPEHYLGWRLGRGKATSLAKRASSRNTTKCALLAKFKVLSEVRCPVHCIFMRQQCLQKGNKGINLWVVVVGGVERAQQPRQDHNRELEAGRTGSPAEPTKLPPQSGRENISSDKHLKGCVPGGIIQGARHKSRPLAETWDPTLATFAML